MSAEETTVTGPCPACDYADNGYCTCECHQPPTPVDPTVGPLDEYRGQ